MRVVQALGARSRINVVPMVRDPVERREERLAKAKLRGPRPGFARLRATPWQSPPLRSEDWWARQGLNL